MAGANSDVRLAVIGCGGRGRAHIKAIRSLKGARLAAICDVDEAHLRGAAQGLGPGVRTYRDLRELLASPEIDAVTVVTPNHWHALAGIWACQAGKDLYVEKPVCHNVWEGRQLMAAAAKSGRIVQAGTQIRSNPGIIEARAWVRGGNLGRIKAVRGLCYKRRESIGLTVGPQPVPLTADYDLWLGPAPHVPLRRKHLHYDWHWVWPTGNGDLGNQGIHQLDIARWFLGEGGIARHAWSVGGRLGYVDDGETPNTLAMVQDYPAGPLIFEVRGLPSRSDSASMDAYLGASIGIVVHCEGGSLVIPSYSSARALDRDGGLVKSFEGEGNHFQNFVDCVRSRRFSELRAPLREGYESSCLAHTGNISYELGRSLSPDEIRERIKGTGALFEAVGRMTEHLAANGVDLGKTPLRLGLPLSFDSKTHRFSDNPAADALLTRAYRAPFAVPHLV